MRCPPNSEVDKLAFSADVVSHILCSEDRRFGTVTIPYFQRVLSTTSSYLQFYCLTGSHTACVCTHTHLQLYRYIIEQEREREGEERGGEKGRGRERRGERGREERGGKKGRKGEKREELLVRWFWCWLGQTFSSPEGQNDRLPLSVQVMRALNRERGGEREGECVL